MAEIPVERKEGGGGLPKWLLPLLLLLPLLGLIYYCTRNPATVTNTNGNTNGNVMMNANRAGAAMNGSANGAMSGANGAMTGANGSVGGNTAVVVNSNGAAGAATTANGGNNAGAVVSDVNLYGTTTDKATLVGRGFFADAVRVNRVVSDKVFTVKSGSGEFFVMLDNNLDSAGGKEKQIKMRAGQNVNLGGEFRNVPSGEVKEETKEGGLNKNEYAQMKGQNVYLHATSVSDAK